MGDWISVPSFVDDEMVTAAKFQDIWTNMQLLIAPNYTEMLVQGVSGGIGTTSSTTFAAISTSLARHTFASYGGDILAVAQITHLPSVSGGSGKYRFTLDGVAYGNTNGLARMQRHVTNSGFPSFQLVHIFTGIAAGLHTLDIDYAVGPAAGGNVTVYQSPGIQNRFWIREF